MKYLDPKNGVEITKTVGKTVAAIETGFISGEDIDEPIIYIIFKDDTWTGIVMPADCWACEIKVTAKVKKTKKKTHAYMAGA